jgi:N-acetylmuramoyl-L-alanine amidase
VPDLVVLHYTAMADALGAADWLCNPESEVSAHYLIARDGEVMSLVPEALRAWHAGAGAWGQVGDVNSRSIGIEIDNPGNSPFDEMQMVALETLLDGIFRRWRIRPERVIGHSDMAPGRKIDPGPFFDWKRLARAGFSVWPRMPETVMQPDVGRFRALAAAFGYTSDVTDDVLLSAVRLRFRPGHTGPLDATDMAILDDLADRYPVDVNATWV